VVNIDLRGAMRTFATGVCVMTTYLDEATGRRHDGLTVNSLTSVSLDPPLVSVCLRHDSAFLADLLKTKVWALSILDVGAADIACEFAKSRDVRAAVLCTVSATPGKRTGALVLDAPGWLECRLRSHLPAGDHVIAIGDVVATGTQKRRPPLVFLNGAYQAIT
jgi:flavin reductase (DIM6/NTAB) family NADH-FMN oxidoreductase RutF